MADRRSLSLRARVLAGIVVVAIALVAVSAVVTATTRGEMVSQVDDRLRSIDVPTRVARPAPGAGEPGQGGQRQGEPGPAAGRARQVQRIGDVYVGFMNLDGELVTAIEPSTFEEFGPPSIDLDSLRGQRTMLFTTGGVGTDTTLRVLTRDVSDGYVVVAVSLDGVRASMRRLMLLQLVAAVAILAALGAMAWWVIRLGVRPIKEMSAAASGIARGDLGVRVPASPPGTEAGELSMSLNQMLGTINDAMDERADGEERLRRFVADASHELRTPVTTIRGYAELYRVGGLEPGEQLDDAMRRTEQEAVRMGRLVEDMLLLAKFDQARPLARGDVDIASVLEDVASDARLTDPDRSIEVAIAAGDGAGGGLDDADGLVVVGDDDRIRQIVVNLVGNALVHTPTGTPIELRAHRSTGVVVIAVSDRGPGMRPDVVDKVTERFFRADPARAREHGGSGLGLSIVDAAVRAHGGSVDIESTPGLGTTVRFTLPVEGADLD